jgi:hypothetical protein
MRAGGHTVDEELEDERDEVQEQQAAERRQRRHRAGRRWERARAVGNGRAQWGTAVYPAHACASVTALDDDRRTVDAEQSPDDTLRTSRQLCPRLASLAMASTRRSCPPRPGSTRAGYPCGRGEAAEDADNIPKGANDRGDDDVERAGRSRNRVQGLLPQKHRSRLRQWLCTSPSFSSIGVALVCAAFVCTTRLTGHFSAALKSSEN